MTLQINNPGAATSVRGYLFRNYMSENNLLKSEAIR